MNKMFFISTVILITTAMTPRDAGATSIPLLVKNLAAWYDASTSANVTLSSLSISAFKDISGNGETLTQSTSANQPLYATSGINGLGSVVFNGSSQYLVSTDTNFSRLLLPTSTVFIVQSSNNNTQNSRTLASSTIYAAKIPYNNNVAFEMGNGSTNRLSAPTSTVSSMGSHVWTLTGNQTTGSERFNIDGTRISSTSGAVSTSTITCPLTVGALNGCGYLPQDYFSGEVGEILVYSPNLSGTEYQYIEGYLACKWGLQTNLPASHPYYSFCPTSTVSLALSLNVTPSGASSPLSDLTYSLQYTNDGGAIDYSPTVIEHIPGNTDFKINSVSVALGSTGLASGISYSNDNGSTYVYAPVSGGGGALVGYDRNVTDIRFILTGPLAPAPLKNSGTLTYSAEIR